MDSNNENKNNEKPTNPDTNEKDVTSIKKSDKPDLKHLITKIDNRVKTKVNKHNLNLRKNKIKKL